MEISRAQKRINNVNAERKFKIVNKIRFYIPEFSKSGIRHLNDMRKNDLMLILGLCERRYEIQLLPHEVEFFKTKGYEIKEMKK